MTSLLANHALDPRPVSDGYRPGVCNIGPMEIDRRRMVGHVGLVATLAVLGTVIVVDAPPLVRIAAAIPAMISASGYLQAHLRFCAGYGQRGMFNFGGDGDASRVADERSRAADRRRARQISAASLLIGLAVGAVGVLLPL